MIRDGFGSDKIFAGTGNDRIRMEGTQDQFDGNGDSSGQDVVYGEKGRDNINAKDIVGSFLIYAGDDDDIIAAGGIEPSTGKIYGGGGNDNFNAGGEGSFDVWGGSGDDEISGSSECDIPLAFGESGNDRIISPRDFASGGSGDDYIEFTDCGGVAYGDAGNDELRGEADATVELHGGSGDDILFVGARLFGEDGNDTLTGDDAPNFFSCGPGIDTITNFNPAEGDTKTADCENF